MIRHSSIALSFASLLALSSCMVPAPEETGSASLRTCIPGDPDAGCGRGQECVPSACAFWCSVDDPECCPNEGTCLPLHECRPVVCALWCPNGMKNGPDGCPTCECEELPACEDLGGTCEVSPFDPGFAADCEGELGMDTAEGECPAFNQSCCVPREPQGEPCGGFMGLTCGQDEYCAYAPDAMCGAADQMGVCTPRPDACIQVYEPVCGCDGQTHSNACMAASAGTSVAHDGECAEPPTDCREDGCGRGEYCSFCWGQWACLPRGAVC